MSRLRVEDGETGPNGEEYCWWQVTVKGGRETRNLDAVTLARVSKYMSISMYMPIYMLVSASPCPWTCE